MNEFVSNNNNILEKYQAKKEKYGELSLDPINIAGASSGSNTPSPFRKISKKKAFTEAISSTSRR